MKNNGENRQMRAHVAAGYPGFFHGDLLQGMERFLAGGSDQSDVVTSQWAPRVDVKEEEKRFVIQADIPGVDPKDIEINMDKGMLTIKGERNVEKIEENEQFTRSERQHGVFYRRFALPDTANPEGIKATGKNGVLEISIPKRPESTPRRIAVA
jgi:HSP20 family protein